MENNNNDSNEVVAPTFQVGEEHGLVSGDVTSIGTVAEVTDDSITIDSSTNEMSQEQLATVLAALKNAQPTNFKARFQGIVGTAKPRVSMFWFNGKRLTKDEHDKLSWEEVHASNNIIRKG